MEKGDAHKKKQYARRSILLDGIDCRTEKRGTEPAAIGIRWAGVEALTITEMRLPSDICLLSYSKLHFLDGRSYIGFGNRGKIKRLCHSC